MDADRSPKALMPFGGATLVAARRRTRRGRRVASPASIVVAPCRRFEDRGEGSRRGGSACDEVVAGGETRQASVRAGLSAVALDVERILLSRRGAPARLRRPVHPSLDALEGVGRGGPGAPVADTVKRVQDGRVEGTEPRDALALAQTPQAFRLGGAPRRARARRRGRVRGFRRRRCCSSAPATACARSTASART